MRKRIAAVTVAACALGMVAGAALAVSASSKDDRVLFGVLLGKNEINADTGKKRAGDPDGRGSASATVKGDELCFGLTVKDLDKPAAAHIHRGNKGENGPIVVNLTAPADGDHGATSGCVTDDDVSDVVRSPRKYYWNVHTAAFPAGAIRGQVAHKKN